MSTNIEIERKYLVLTLPALEDAGRPETIRQGYITSGGECREVRIRQIGDRYVLGVKHGTGVAREEFEVELDASQFEPLWGLTEGWRLEKKRYYIRYGSHTIELDIYSGNLDGLVVAEVEFSSMDASETFVPPAWFGREISEDLTYKNSRLAHFGLPAGYSKPKSR